MMKTTARSFFAVVFMFDRELTQAFENLEEPSHQIPQVTSCGAHLPLRFAVASMDATQAAKRTPPEALCKKYKTKSLHKMYFYA
jgi:hypothetical protein